MGCATSSEMQVASMTPYPRQQQQQQQQYYNTNTQKPVANVQPQVYPPQQQVTQQQQPAQEKTPSAPPPQQQQQQQPQAVQTQPKGQPVTMEMLKRYMTLEKEIRELERKNVVGNLQMKKEQLLDIKKTEAQLEKYYNEVCKKVEKEKADVDKMNEPSVRQFFADQQTFDATLSKEQEEYLEAVGEQEVAKKQLDGIKEQTKGLDSEVKSLDADVERLKKLYDEQDELLDKIFSGEYGSDLENRLEREVDMLLDEKERVGVAKYKWTNSRVLLQHACNQLAFAVRRWEDLAGVHPSNVQLRYQIATETRNNLIAASQNMTSAQRYLAPIQFPYCQPAEIETLDRACKNIYIDMQTPDRQKHALQCYSITHKRAAALLQWFDSVINKSIHKDMETATKSLGTKEGELRKERLRLIKERMGQELGPEAISDPEDTKGGEEEVNVSVSKPDVVTGAEGLSQGSADEQATLKSGEDHARDPTPLPTNELAPAPSSDELFGNIEQLKKQHEQELKEFEKAQEMNKARMEQGLQEKLKMRRSRRQRIEEQQTQSDVAPATA
ncbi:serine/threonine-protein kinase dst2-like [Gigantopelta aegis]|uniref:serine/threonine-protein kinase dst2-like n=1 Tax=Gigantopelta aegis TaxID=1735272 RepID=UPI001B88C90E|nr:serine/threonine-protein kinase dst2-like [Gigantopelta aegis]